MNNIVLTSTEYEKIIHFAAQITRPVKEIQLHILNELARIFGYEDTIFWSSDNHGNIANPISNQRNDTFLHEYLGEYHTHDILCPKKNLHLYREKKAIRIADLITPEQYENSPYYRSFMKSYGFYDEMGMALIHEGVVIGIIGMAYKKGQRNFTAIDCKRSQYLSDIITSVLVHKFKDEMDFSMLSKREEDVVKLLKKGCTNQNIAEELHISINTVKKHLQHIYQRHSVQNRTQLVEKLKI